MEQEGWGPKTRGWGPNRFTRLGRELSSRLLGALDHVEPEVGFHDSRDLVHLESKRGVGKLLHHHAPLEAAELTATGGRPGLVRILADEGLEILAGASARVRFFGAEACFVARARDARRRTARALVLNEQVARADPARLRFRGGRGAGRSF